MKSSLLLTCSFLAAAPLLLADPPADYVSESKSSSETFTSKVLKVYSFSEGDVEYIAYVVNWRGHEIVVAPGLTPPGQPLGVGDPIRCTMHAFSRPSGPTRVSFMMALPPGEAPGLLPDPANEQIRLQAIAAEIERRRAIRQEALNAVQSERAGKRPAESKSAP